MTRTRSNLWAYFKYYDVPNEFKDAENRAIFMIGYYDGKGIVRATDVHDFRINE